ncbi:oxidoreductase [Frankia sp. Mgl5]|uniref:NADH-quinone oxidoreductase subunit B family protein n=1 Tax=Frankia sp. Mgl5 TaxID=2933793 RepID=UPI00200FE0F0|nr:oxidoreductase [Frankia sp. Mgl5]MCK9930596.1 oxidoreductase [Frankia sp. Mgl5]
MPTPTPTRTPTPFPASSPAPTATPAARPRLAVWKFASCDGCQLTLLNREDELLPLASQVEISYFLEASSATVAGPYDLSLVEGSVTTGQDAERIQQIRAASRRLVTIGACATAGGIQALRNFADVRGFLAAVYATAEYVSTLSTSTPISAHVRVDFELQGCPIDGRQLIEVISAFLAGRRPGISSSSVCTECKRRGTVCVMVAHGTPCLGPVTHAGCGAICPAYHRGCYGCFGPMESPNAPALTRQLKVLGMDDDDVGRVFQTFNAAAPAFRAASGGSEDGGSEGGGRSDHDN